MASVENITYDAGDFVDHLDDLLVLVVGAENHLRDGECFVVAVVVVDSLRHLFDRLKVLHHVDDARDSRLVLVNVAQGSIADGPVEGRRKSPI